jgi:hypothetical protein
MATHASDHCYPSNIRCRWGKRHTMVMKFLGGVVLVVNGILVLFLPYKFYVAGVFFPARTLMAVKLLIQHQWTDYGVLDAEEAKEKKTPSPLLTIWLCSLVYLMLPYCWKLILIKLTQKRFRHQSPHLFWCRWWWSNAQEQGWTPKRIERCQKVRQFNVNDRCSQSHLDLQ